MNVQFRLPGIEDQPELFSITEPRMIANGVFDHAMDHLPAWDWFCECRYIPEVTAEVARLGFTAVHEAIDFYEATNYGCPIAT